MNGSNEILKGYADEAPDIIPRFEALAAADVLAPVQDFLPPPPASVADIGAGTGRDADWFARQGYRVTAVEPVAELAGFGVKHHSPAISWVDDRLPGLSTLCSADRQFDLVFVGSVWHHFGAEDSQASLAALAQVLHPAGRLIISLKVFASEDPMAQQALSRDAVVQHAEAAGLTIIYSNAARPHQDHNRTAGNMWAWLVMEHAGGAVQ